MKLGFIIKALKCKKTISCKKKIHNTHVDPDFISIKLKKYYRKPIDSNTMGAYEIYTATSKAEALKFLEGYRIDQDNFFVEVETPEGTVGKDRMGIY